MIFSVPLNMDQDTKVAARRLLKSHLRRHLSSALANEDAKWAALVHIEDSIEQQAQESWERAKLSWALDDLRSVVEAALQEAASDVRPIFTEVRGESWVDEHIREYQQAFNVLGFLGVSEA